ncbi:MAG TPA: hypothetical protein EYP10_09920, partial [Armatimonadetes bacterium]|nr:hypothetical protein [Armatimonadota bacterium]
GMQLHTGIKVESLDELFAQGFNAIFIEIGTQRPVRLGIEGEEHHCVIDGLSFLKRVNLGERFDIGKRIGVIGGGNVAIDAARVALRLGAEEVIILYRRTRTEMPALGEEIEAAIEEGVKIEFLVTPRRIIPQNNCIDVELIRMRLGAPDETGRRRPIPIEGSEFRMNFDTLIVAIGQTTDIPEGFGLELTQRGLIKVDQETLATSREGVFAGGDVVLGPSSVIEAIAQGRIAAESIDKFLGGTGEIDEQLTDEDKPDMWMGRIEGFAQLHKVTVRHLPPLQRKMNFEEVELGYTEEEAVAEAIRCLRCDLRFYLSPPLRTIICGGNS